jgi:hypothetical protein
MKRKGMRNESDKRAKGKSEAYMTRKGRLN